HVQKQSAIYQQRRDVLAAGLRKLGWEVESPRATMFVWAKISPEHMARFNNSSIDLCMAMVDQAEVAMTPGAAFGEGGEGYVRLALVENEQRIKQAIRQLDRVLRKSGAAVI